MILLKIFSIQITILVIFYIDGFLQVNGRPLSEQSKFGQHKHTVIFERCIQPGVVALTFDDGPNHRTLKVLNVLRELNVTATFFINGGNYMDIDDEKAKTIIQRTINEGHSIGSHTWSHMNLTDGHSFDEIEYQMNHLSDKFLQIFHKRITVMRPPFGGVNNTVIDIVGGQLGYEIITWSIDTKDWSHPENYEAGLKHYIESLNGTDPKITHGFISLHHDTIPHSDKFAAIVIKYVRSMDYRFVSLKECLGI